MIKISQKLHFFQKKFAYITKKCYLCTRKTKVYCNKHNKNRVRTNVVTLARTQK